MTSRRGRQRLLAVSAMVATGSLSAACGGEGTATEAATTNEGAAAVEALGTDRLRFEPDELTIPAGRDVILEFSAASVEHDFVVEAAAASGSAEAGHPADEPGDLHVAHAESGETVTATFAIDKAGTYTVYCSIPGHRDAGMVASLTVHRS